MHLETLKTYCDLIETGSFSRAASINFVTQSAVSQQMKALEDRYQTILIERDRKQGVKPTDAGKLLYGEFKEIWEKFSNLDNKLNADADVISGSIRIAAVYSVGLHELPPYVKQFIKAHPQIKVHVEYSRTDKVYESCLNNTIDFGIIALPFKRPNLTVIPFREDRLLITVNPEHPFAKKRRISVKSLAGQDFIAFEKDIPTRKTIDAIFKQYKVSVDYVMEFDNIETVKRSAEVGIGISILPETAIANELRTGTLKALEFTEGTFTRSIGVIHRKGKILNPAMNEFIKLLTEKI